MSYLWWEDIKIHNQVYGVEGESISQTRVIRCPVCKSALGKKMDGEVFTEFCVDCNTTYTWTPGTSLPTAVIGRTKDKKRCTCSACNARDGIVDPEEPEKPPEGQDIL